MGIVPIYKRMHDRRVYAALGINSTYALITEIEVASSGSLQLWILCLVEVIGISRAARTLRGPRNDILTALFMLCEGFLVANFAACYESTAMFVPAVMGRQLCLLNKSDSLPA